jgi:hypothetical protein
MTQQIKNTWLNEKKLLNDVINHQSNFTQVIMSVMYAPYVEICRKYKFHGDINLKIIKKSEVTYCT